MFEAILQGNKQMRRVGRGAVVSIVIHALVISGVVYLSVKMGKKTAKVAMAKVTFMQAKEMQAAPPPPPPPPPPPRRSRKVVTTKTVPIEDPQTLIKTNDKTEDKSPKKPEEDDDGVEGGVEGGVKGGVVGGVLGGQVGGQLKQAAIPFGAGMTRPTKIGGNDPQYTREALAARVEGMMIVRCVITTEGKLENCKVIKSLPHMEKAVLDALATHRYTPVMFQGKPVSVQYVFNIRLVIP